MAPYVNKTGRREWLVFISHAAQDTWVASCIEREIARIGAATFLDEANLDVGDNFSHRIFDALRRAKELVVYSTPWAIKRPFVWMEIGAACAQKLKPRLILVLHGISIKELQKQDLPVIIEGIQMIDINQIDKYFKQLDKRIRNYRNNS